MRVRGLRISKVLFHIDLVSHNASVLSVLQRERVIVYISVVGKASCAQEGSEPDLD